MFKLCVEYNKYIWIYQNKTIKGSYLDSCGLVVPALNNVGEACVNHFSDNKLYVCNTRVIKLIYNFFTSVFITYYFQDNNLRWICKDAIVSWIGCGFMNVL